MRLKQLIKALICCLAVCSCSSNNTLSTSSENIEYLANQEYIYGMDYTSLEGVFNKIDYKKAYEMLNNMGVKSVRNWMHCTYFFDSKFNRNESNIELMKDMIKIMQGYNMQIIGLNHKNFNKYGKDNAKIARDMTPNSYYLEWLNTIEETYYVLATTFPEITIWEIDNETNNNGFMENAIGGQFTLQEMIDISTDIFYYGSKGLHRANPNIQTVMGGFVTWNGEAFLEGVYKNIESGNFGEGSKNPDDYFQCLAWHPYTKNFDEESFVRDNQAIYDISLKYEKKAKKVYFTELGNWTSCQNATKAAKYLKEVYAVTLKYLPFVESIHYYRCFDNILDDGNNSGLFHDPNIERIDYIFGTETRANPGSPKEAAYAYQEMTGGSGPLNLLEIILNEEEK